LYGLFLSLSERLILVGPSSELLMRLLGLT
jgi:hypothetical protein